MSRREQKTGRAALCGMLIALAFLFSYVETLIPISLGIPGVKLGLANLVTIVGLYLVSLPQLIFISLVRIVLVGLTFGNGFSMIYSLAGGALSLLFMLLARKTGWFSQAGVSVAGGGAQRGTARHRRPCGGKWSGFLLPSLPSGSGKRGRSCYRNAGRDCDKADRPGGEKTFIEAERGALKAGLANHGR